MINHFHPIQLRVVGSGNLCARLIGLNESETQELVPIVMNATTGREPVYIASFVQERAKLKIYTTEIDEKFHIKKITIYIKPIYTSGPQ